MAWEAEAALLGTQFHVLHKQLGFSSHLHVPHAFYSFCGALECLTGIEWASCYGSPGGQK